MIRILHLSDVHVASNLRAIPVERWFNKRLIGGANHVLRRSRHFVDAHDKLQNLALLAERESVDLVICTGDYTVLGTESEMHDAFAAVEPLTKRPRGFLTVPGNHDVYLGDSLEHRVFDRAFGSFVTSDRPDDAIDGRFPFVRFFDDDLVVIGVDSTKPNPLPWSSTGAIPAAQLTKLERLLADPDIRRRFVIVMTHYAPRLWNGRPDSASHGLENADAFLAITSKIERGAILHGHVHRRYSVRLPSFRPTLLCAGSTTAEGHEGFWILEIGADGSRAIPGRYVGGRYATVPEETVTL